MDNLPKTNRDDDCDEELFNVKRLKGNVSPGKQQHQQQCISRKLDLKTAVGGIDSGNESEEDSQPEPEIVKKPIKKAVVVPQTEVSFRAAEWYYADEGKHCGPFSADDLCDIYPSILTPETYAWASGYVTDWIPVHQISELYSYLETVTNPTENSSSSMKKIKSIKQQIKQNDNEWFDLKVNTSIYISQLPSNVTSEELLLFFKNVGAVKIDPLLKKPKVKIYKNNDALITFMKPQSVDLSIQIYDEALLRNSDLESVIRVEAAQFKKKGDTYKPKQNLSEYREAMKKSKKQIDSKMAWTETDSDPVARSVVIKNFFSEKFSSELKHVVKEYVSQFGNIEMIKPSAGGTVTIRFKSFISAQDCVQNSHGKELSGRLMDINMCDSSELL